MRPRKLMVVVALVAIALAALVARRRLGAGPAVHAGRPNGAARRRTEQGDALAPEHSIAAQQGRPEQPYRPPSQPAQRRDSG